MATFGKLQAALAAATNEVTVAAANINFDFTLVKYEAPKEFRPLEGYLTTTRKQDAESGKSHVIARRLGALFSGICPDTPNLIKAYGARVSEISKTATQKESQEYSKSIFASYIGVDATSIWAAATSSKSAIHVHLLACMLAELWDASEATSIWVELVEKRRKDIAHRLEQGETLHFGLASAAVQQEITRDQLASWDASARAWIQTGKSVMRRNDTQLRLILKNVYFAINPSEAPFVSVIDAWKLAIETTEKLILGIPQEAQNGAAILGLSAWHIYPDIHVYGTKNTQVSMNDELVGAGGILSLASCPSHGTESRGVYWSLCLSHLTFYGPPVKRHQSLEEDSRRIPFANLLHATVGAILSRWRVSSSDLVDATNILSTVFDTIGIGNTSFHPAMALISNAAKECLNDDKAWSHMLYGKRRSGFIKDPDLQKVGAIRAFFGLSGLTLLLSCTPELQDRMSILQRLTRRVDLSDQEVIMFDLPSSTVHDIDLGLLRSSNKRSKRRKKTSKQAEYRIDGLELYQGSGNNESVFDFWIGDSSSTAIYKKRVTNGLQTDPPTITLEDMRWCFNNSLVCPHSLIPKHIMGLSFENSIIVPSSLVRDPGDKVSKVTKLTRILGNIGRPGLTMLIPPADPMLASLDEGTWRISNLNNFNGRPEDMFSTTSLHLSFTDWSQPLTSVGNSGNRDGEGSLMEAVVSIKDSGRWVGDIDILKALESDMIHLAQPNSSCSHERGSLPQNSIHSIECWDELRDCPEEQAVIRASGNWVARLAATSYLAQKMSQKGMRPSRIVICPTDVCWDCRDAESNMDDIFIH
ncbi:Ff.00g035280.m01.CDS01 [Fusarium sp. VM40]|nr:Ff.00g035280.m01.CDS01 [Fusarium sp. VM40]